MKNKIILICFAVMLILTANSCKKYLDVNQNDNQPTSVRPNVLLPSAESSIAYSMGGDADRFTAVFAQYITGYNRQFFGYNRYIFTEEDFNTLWNNLYAGGMKDLNDIITIGNTQPGKYTVYQACAKILMAYTLGLATDMWGDVPYSQAFMGANNLHPAFDNQQSVYNTIQSLLNSGIDSLTNGAGLDLMVPGADDFMYSGSPSGWIGFANGLKARFDLHLTKKGTATYYANVLTDLGAGALTSNSGDAQFHFSSVAQNPWYQYINNRDDISYSTEYGVPVPFIDTLIAKGDPRNAIYIDVNGAYDFGPGYVGPFFASASAPVIFFTYSEQKFIEAEALLMTGDNAGAQTAYLIGINADMDRLGIPSTDSLRIAYVDSNSVLKGTQENKLSQIIYQKYVALYLQTESYNDYRRLGLPVLPVNPGVLTQIPRRFIYPTSEDTYNSGAGHCPKGSSLLTPQLWWDN